VDNPIQKFAVFIMLPFILAVPPILGWFIGMWLDKHLHTAPYLKYVCLILGLLAGARECYRLIKEYGDKT
jgi:ATP synthase protein I